MDVKAQRNTSLDSAIDDRQHHKMPTQSGSGNDGGSDDFCNDERSPTRVRGKSEFHSKAFLEPLENGQPYPQ